MNRHELIKEIGLEGVRIVDFSNSCPHDYMELKSESTNWDLSKWRYLGILISYCDTNDICTVVKAAFRFDRDHSTATRAITKIANQPERYTDKLELIKEARNNRIKNVPKKDKNAIQVSIERLYECNTMKKLDKLKTFATNN